MTFLHRFAIENTASGPPWIVPKALRLSNPKWNADGERRTIGKESRWRHRITSHVGVNSKFVRGGEKSLGAGAKWVRVAWKPEGSLR
jgi:hypothetical protein